MNVNIGLSATSSAAPTANSGLPGATSRAASSTNSTASALSSAENARMRGELRPQRRAFGEAVGSGQRAVVDGAVGRGRRRAAAVRARRPAVASRPRPLVVLEPRRPAVGLLGDRQRPRALQPDRQLRRPRGQPGAAARRLAVLRELLDVGEVVLLVGHLKRRREQRPRQPERERHREHAAAEPPPRQRLRAGEQEQRERERQRQHEPEQQPVRPRSDPRRPEQRRALEDDGQLRREAALRAGGRPEPDGDLRVVGDRLRVDRRRRCRRARTSRRTSTARCGVTQASTGTVAGCSGRTRDRERDLRAQLAAPRRAGAARLVQAAARERRAAGRSQVEPQRRKLAVGLTSSSSTSPVLRRQPQVGHAQRLAGGDGRDEAARADAVRAGVVRLRPARPDDQADGERHAREQRHADDVAARSQRD